MTAKMKKDLVSIIIGAVASGFILLYAYWENVKNIVFIVSASIFGLALIGFIFKIITRSTVFQNFIKKFDHNVLEDKKI